MPFSFFGKGGRVLGCSTVVKGKYLELFEGKCFVIFTAAVLGCDCKKGCCAKCVTGHGVNSEYVVAVCKPMSREVLCAEGFRVCRANCNSTCWVLEGQNCAS